MTDDIEQIDQLHRKLAIDCFNGAWDLIDNPKRTREEDDKMVHMAHASRYHWGEIGTQVEIERGEWQISRVYAILGRVEPAMHHAKRCLAICLENNIGDFDIAFAYEGMARAHFAAGDRKEALNFLIMAREAIGNIRDDNDREYTRSEVDKLSKLID